MPAKPEQPEMQEVHRKSGVSCATQSPLQGWRIYSFHLGNYPQLERATLPGVTPPPRGAATSHDSHIQSCPEALKTMPLTTIQDISKGFQSSHEVGQSLCGAQYLFLLHPDSLPSSQVAIPGAPFCRLTEISLKVSFLGNHPSSFGISEGNREVCFKAKKKDIEQSNKKL